MSSAALLVSAVSLPRPHPTTTLPPPLPPPPSFLAPDHAVSLLDRCKSSRRYLLEIHAAVLRAGLQHHPLVNFKLQRCYSSLGFLDHTLSLFRLTARGDRNVYFWTAVIQAHAVHGFDYTALHLFVEMLSDAVVAPNAFTFSSVLKVCDIRSGKAVHCQSVKLGLGSEPYVATTLLDMYARGGDVISARRMFDVLVPVKNLVSFTAMITCYAKVGELEQARMLFDELENKDVVCWNAMIDGYTQHGRSNVALALFRQMLKTSVGPNEVTVLSVLSACAQLGTSDSGIWVHSYITNNRIPVDTQVATALIDMYSKCGSLEDACLVFGKIPDEKKDVVCWNAMIMGYAMHGHSRDALHLFDRMRGQGIRPTDITFIGALSACSHAGLVAEGRQLFRSMEEDHQIRPKIEHYGCMVDLLGRAGFVKEAFDLVRSMTIKPDPLLWGTLLGACRLHKKIDLGEKIAKFLVESGLANSGTYVLLSNIYSTMGNWEEAARVRTMMKESGIQKEPGCTSIEVDNKVHEFLVGDLSHPKTKQIYSMLDELNGLLRAHGYVPQTDVVLHDMEELEKERALGVHSEKLAIAFGLISSSPGATIKIVKNLRICVDCHTVTKLISKITRRKIVARDRNRFHHFVDGLCSCGDYW